MVGDPYQVVVALAGAVLEWAQLLVLVVALPIAVLAQAVDKLGLHTDLALAMVRL